MYEKASLNRSQTKQKTQNKGKIGNIEQNNYRFVPLILNHKSLSL